MNKKLIPTYSISKFSKNENIDKPYQVEIFDAKRHFKVQYPHRHDFFEILFISKGSGIHIIDDKKYVIEPPCLFFLSPGQAHQLELSTDIEGYIFLFTSEFFLLNKSNKNRLLELPFFFNINQENPPIQINTKTDFLTSIFKNSCNEMESESTKSEQIILATLDLILAIADQEYIEREATEVKGKGHLLVKQFRQLLEEKYQDIHNINDYADLLNVTPNHLTQTIKQLTGKTSSNLINEKLIIEIKRLLIHTDNTSSEIANSLNFKDQSYFSRYFKRHTGSSPIQFREKSMKST